MRVTPGDGLMSCFAVLAITADDSVEPASGVMRTCGEVARHRVVRRVRVGTVPRLYWSEGTGLWYGRAG
jgi:hypothetical protein